MKLLLFLSISSVAGVFNRDILPDYKQYTLVQPQMFHYRWLYDLLKLYLEEVDTAKSDLFQDSFHLLLHYKKGVTEAIYDSCDQLDPMASLAESEIIPPYLRTLAATIHQNLPGVQFGLADVISLAGKVVVEDMYHCVRVKWRPGRKLCSLGRAVEPQPGYETFDQLTEHLSHYNLNATELAILIAGAHGNGEATWMGRDLSRHQLISEYLSFNLNGASVQWKAIKTGSKYLPKVIYKTFVSKYFDIFRMPLDFIFFPSTVTKANEGKDYGTADSSMLGTEEAIRKIVNDNSEVKLERIFARLFSQLLEVGFIDLSDEYYNDLPLDHDDLDLNECQRDPDWGLY